MKLHYFKPSKGNGNFGDNINPWLWEKLIPDFLDEDKTVAFIGIGTLINDSLPLSTPMAKKRIIFSTGVGYGKLSTINIDSSYHIYCVRGPLSAFKLGLSVDYGVTDGAILVKNVFDYKLKKNHKYSYMPHHNSVNKNWKIICQQLNISYIDPSLPVEEVLSEIAQTEILLTEAMHGAIIADTFRVPWIPIVTRNGILLSKWIDWCFSVGLEYEPKYLPQLHYRQSYKKDLITPMRNVKYLYDNWNNRRDIFSPLPSQL